MGRGLEVLAHNLTGIVDAIGNGAFLSFGVVNGGKRAVGVEEAMQALVIPVVADDLPGIVDANGVGACAADAEGAGVGDLRIGAAAVDEAMSDARADENGPLFARGC